jgi:ubiquinol-cytochrome c reductase iron-sulfur subunit
MNEHAMTLARVNQGRRRFLITTTTLFGGAGVIGICTHLGCVPTFRPDVTPVDLGTDGVGGYFCPCDGSKFGLADRVYKGVPAPTNLVVPPYQFLSKTQIRVGKDAVMS